MAMSDEHKAALAEGRRQAVAIKRYLGALERRRPGRPVTRQSLEKRIAALQEKITAEQDSLRRVDLIQQRLDAERSLAEVGQESDLSALEAKFVKFAKDYSDRKGISYSAWREMGVPANVLRQAGVPRTRRT